MYQRVLSNDREIRRFTITKTPAGWDVRDIHGDHAHKVARYLDWHRVERAKLAFALVADQLRREGWVEIGDPVGIGFDA